MENFRKALDFVEANQENEQAIMTLLEQLLCEASDEIINKALTNTLNFINYEK